MAFAGNILWFIFGGWLAFLIWVFYALIFAISIVGIPFAYASWRIAIFAAVPFGRELVDARQLGEKRIAGTAILNLVWIVLAGIWLAIFHAVVALLCYITIIGIPWGIAHMKLSKVAFAPLGKRIVSKEVAEEAKKRAAVVEMDERLSKSDK